MIESITVAVELTLVAAFALILGAFAVLLWDLLQGRMRGWLRVMVVVVLAPACALGATVISAGAGLALASALGPDEPPAHTGSAEEDLERTSTERRGSETTTERSRTPSATPTPSPASSPTATASPSASPSP